MKLDVNSLTQKDLIKGHPRLLLIIQLALQTGVLKYDPQCYETDVDEETKEIRRDGYYAEDITGFWHPSDFGSYLSANINNFKEAMEDFGFWKAFKFLSLTLPWSGWCYVLDAKKTIAYDIVDDQITAERSQGKKVDYKNYDERAKAVTPEQIQERLTKDYVQIHPALWVSPHDPTCFVADEDIIPFAKKDGWTNAQLGEILVIWFEAMTGHKVKPQHIPNASW
jgi:hypothetical protein